MATTDAPIAPTAPVAPVALTLARKGDHSRTYWVEGEYPATDRPEDMFAAFEAAGWTLDPTMESIPSYEPFDMDLTQPSGKQMTFRGYQVRDFTLTKRGTDLFTGWTPDEERTNLAEARALLAEFGFHDVPVWSKTLADML